MFDFFLVLLGTVVVLSVGVAAVVFVGCAQLQALLHPPRPPPAQGAVQSSIALRPVYDAVPSARDAAGGTVRTAASPESEPQAMYTPSQRMFVGVTPAVDEQYGQLVKAPPPLADEHERYGQLSTSPPANNNRQLPPLQSERELPPLPPADRSYNVVPADTARDDAAALKDRLRQKLAGVNQNLRVDDDAVNLYNNFPKPPQQPGAAAVPREEALGEYKLSTKPVAKPALAVSSRREEPQGEYGLKQHVSPRQVSPRQVSPRGQGAAVKRPQTPPDSEDEREPAPALYTQVRAKPRTGAAAHADGHVSKSPTKAARQITASSKAAF